MEDQNQDTKPRPKTWWKRKEVIGAIGLVILNGAASPAVATIHPMIPIIANVALGILTVTGIVKGIEGNNLTPTKENYKIGD